MSHAISPGFAARILRIRRTNRRIAAGGDLHIGPDGLLTIRRRRHMPGAGLLRAAVFVTLVVFAAKAVMLASVGPTAYAARLDALGGASLLDRSGASIMQADGVTRFLAAILAPVLG